MRYYYYDGIYYSVELYKLTIFNRTRRLQSAS